MQSSFCSCVCVQQQQKNSHCMHTGNGCGFSAEPRAPLQRGLAGYPGGLQNMEKLALSWRAQMEEALGLLEDETSFAGAGDIQALPTMTVEGVGEIELPLDATTAARLLAAGQEAPYGRGTETLVDPEVRRAVQIDASSVSIDPEWEEALDDVIHGEPHASSRERYNGPSASAYPGAGLCGSATVCLQLNKPSESRNCMPPAQLSERSWGPTLGHSALRLAFTSWCCMSQEDTSRLTATPRRSPACSRLWWCSSQ